MFEKLLDAKRMLMEVDLAPVQGDRFQPTGFPDLGGATYQLADGTRMLLVESAQSMANRLENTIIGADNELLKELHGLSYIRVRLTEETETTSNSLIEAHRLNSPFIISDDDFQENFKEAAEYRSNMPINWQKVAHALFKYDVNSLLHGVFLANLDDGSYKGTTIRFLVYRGQECQRGCFGWRQEQSDRPHRETPGQRLRQKRLR